MSYVPDHDSIQAATPEIPHSGRKGPSPQVIAFVVIAALAVIFFLQNSEPTFIDFWVFEKRTTIRWSILMSILLGIALDRLFISWWRRRRSAKASNK